MTGSCLNVTKGVSYGRGGFFRCIASFWGRSNAAAHLMLLHNFLLLEAFAFPPLQSVAQPLFQSDWPFLLTRVIFNSIPRFFFSRSTLILSATIRGLVEPDIKFVLLSEFDDLRLPNTILGCLLDFFSYSSYVFLRPVIPSVNCTAWFQLFFSLSFCSAACLCFCMCLRLSNSSKACEKRLWTTSVKNARPSCSLQPVWNDNESWSAFLSGILHSQSENPVLNFSDVEGFSLTLDCCWGRDEVGSWEKRL